MTASSGVDGEALFELLHFEMVKFLHSETAKDAKVEAVSKLEEMGYLVGLSLTERFTRETPRFTEELEVMKYICKEFWMFLFKKQIDSLRTNHQGIYVLQDNNFKVFSKLSIGMDQKEEANKLLAFPCGLLRGAMTALGIASCVTADVTGLPACKFQIQRI